MRSVVDSVVAIECFCCCRYNLFFFFLHKKNGKCIAPKMPIHIFVFYAPQVKIHRSATVHSQQQLCATETDDIKNKIKSQNHNASVCCYPESKSQVANVHETTVIIILSIIGRWKKACEIMLDSLNWLFCIRVAACIRHRCAVAVNRMCN